MSLGRRKVGIDHAPSWVFNRIADVYDARPAYPVALVDAVARLCDDGLPIADLGAGTGHLAIPLAARGLDVIAIEPARVMLDRLQGNAIDRQVSLRGVHAAAEDLPLPTASVGLVIVADSIHFMDRELAAREIARVLAPRGALALITSEFGDTAFMRGVAAIMEESAPRRARPSGPPMAQLIAVTAARPEREQHFHDETPVDPVTLERILRSISFIGPAMNAGRFAAFCQRIHGLPHPPVWARTFTLRAGRRARRASARLGGAP